MITRITAILTAGLKVDGEGNVVGITDPALCAQAIELGRPLGLLRPLLETQRWFYRPVHLLGLFYTGGDLGRECRLHADWCARSVPHLWGDEDRETLNAALGVVERFANGEATLAELDEARAAARAAAWAEATGAASAVTQTNSPTARNDPCSAASTHPVVRVAS